MDELLNCGNKKRNLSNLSESSTTSQVLLPTKLLKMNSEEIPEANEKPSASENQHEDGLLAVQQAASSGNPTLERKVDEILDFLKAQAVKNELDINLLHSDNKSLQLRVHESEGTIARLSSRVKYLETKIEDLQIYSMKSNILFYNLPEKPEEDTYRIMDTFLRQTLKIPEELLFSKRNPGGEIRIDVSHRVGQKRGKPRPVIVKFLTQRGCDLVRSFAKELKSTPYALSEHLPPSVREKRSAQIPLLIELRKSARQNNSDSNIRLVKDKLIIDSKINTEKFEENPLDYTMSAGDPTNYENLFHSNLRTSRGSAFQGHYYPIHTEGEAIKALRALMQNDLTSKSTHILYAYNYCDDNGQTITGHCDDGEWTGSTILKNLMKERKISNAILMVTRKHGGINLGKQRFKLIKETASDVLDLSYA